MEEFDISKEDWVRELLECPVCFEIPLPPIRLCVEGHIVCNECRGRTKGICPLCRGPNSQARNLLAEGIVARIKTSCKYAKFGCGFTGKLTELRDHWERECDYRPVECYGCTDRLVEYSDYQQHLKTHHKLKFVLSQPHAEVLGVYNVDTSRVDNCAWPQYWFNAYDQVFLIRLYYLNNTHGISPSLNFWVAHFGKKSESNNYTASLEMCPRKSGSLGKGFGCAYKWTLEECPVNNFRDEAIKVIKDGGAMSIRISEILFRSGLNFFANVTGEWHFRIVIRKKTSPTPMLPAGPVSFPVLPSFHQLIKPAKLILPPSLIFPKSLFTIDQQRVH